MKRSILATASMLLACSGSDAGRNDGTEGGASGTTATSPTSSEGEGGGTDGTDDAADSDHNPVFDLGIQPDTGQGCEPGEPGCAKFYDPEFEAEDFVDPVIKCSWTTSPTLITPVIADLEGDGNIEIIFVDDTGSLVVISGDDCAEELRGPAGNFGQRSQLAVADLDEDGDMEILGVSTDAKFGNNRIRAVDHLGSTIAISDAASVTGGSFHHGGCGRGLRRLRRLRHGVPGQSPTGRLRGAGCPLATAQPGLLLGLHRFYAVRLQRGWAVEVVYRDEQILRVYDGPTGDVLSLFNITSGTSWRTPASAHRTMTMRPAAALAPASVWQLAHAPVSASVAI